MQDTFSLYHEVQHFIEYSKYHPRTDSKQRKSRIRVAAKQYIVQDKRLYYVGPDATRKRLVVMSDEERLRVLQECHSSPATGAHRGKRSTRDKVVLSYYWSTLNGDSARWVEECPRCQGTKSVMTVVPTGIANDKMHGFESFDQVEFYLRHGSFLPDLSQTDKYVIRRASKDFVFKDDRLWLMLDNRLVKVVRSKLEVQEVLFHYHDEKKHPGQVKTIQAIRTDYFWSSLAIMVREYVKKCQECAKIKIAGVGRRCVAYGCESDSRHQEDGITFHKFPKDPERLENWLSIAHRDKASLRPVSRLCSKHFQDNRFHMNEKGMWTLREDAVPTVTSCPAQEGVDILSDISSQCSINLENFIAASLDVEAMDQMEDTETVEHIEHQYSLPPPVSTQRSHQKGKKASLKKYSWEPCFNRYDQVVQYLTNGVLPNTHKKIKCSLRRMAKSYCVTDGVLMYTRPSPPRKVLRSREEVNAVLKKFHDNCGHFGQSRCQKAIMKEYHWSNIGPDVADWIANCPTCINRTKRRKFQCSVYRCNNYCGPVERSLGITFHDYPIHNPSLLDQWLQMVRRPGWYPRPMSAVCSSHFTEDCFDRTGDTVTLKPDAVPSLFLFKHPIPNPAYLDHNPPPLLEEVRTQDQAFFAKYDAVELYISKGIYPPGINYVEKNTIRRFCSHFIIKDDLLHWVKGTKVRQVLRSREEVNTALTDFHDELNHLDLKKCMRLLNERFFWSTMRADVARWIDKCSECSKTKMTEPPSTKAMETTKPVKPLQICDHKESYSPAVSEAGYDDDDDNDDVGRPHNDSMAVPVLTVSAQPQSQPSQTTDLIPGSSSLPKLSPQVKRKRMTGCFSVSTTSSSRSKLTASSEGVNSRAVKSTIFKPFQARSPTVSLGPVVESPTPSAPPFGNPSTTPQSPRPLQARAMVQQCTQAKLKVKPAVDGAVAEWVEIQEGMVIYVCFLQGATMEIIPQMVDCLLNTKFFGNPMTQQQASILELSRDILIVPQSTLSGEGVDSRRVLYNDVEDRQWDTQLYNTFVLACKKALVPDTRCTDVRSSVKHGIYGTKQEIFLNSIEPSTHQLAF